MYKITSWRKPHKEKPRFREQFPPFPTTRIFDQMWVIGDPNVCCFLVETSEGLILIDCMFPGEHYLNVLENGIADAGFTGNDLKAVLITHGHFDHYGNADILREKYGCKLYLSKIDHEFALHPNMNSPQRRDPKYRDMDYDLDGYIEDGQMFTLGDTSIKCVLTPGHTPGCLSYIIPVTDEGRQHNAAIWGGAGLIPESDRAAYLASCEKFSKICEEYLVDIEIANHPFVDNTVQRLELIRNICDGVPNPYVIGHEAYKRYEDAFKQECIQIMEKEKGENK